ncbi:MAG: hypothetical protein NWE85_07575, partial [Candidatus Bathyarchaeota archaeon]|nr:hypothetical protein [Candidatus Bathyarchaeota archaeon]
MLFWFAGPFLYARAKFIKCRRLNDWHVLGFSFQLFSPEGFGVGPVVRRKPSGVISTFILLL